MSAPTRRERLLTLHSLAAAGLSAMHDLDGRVEAARARGIELPLSAAEAWSDLATELTRVRGEARYGLDCLGREARAEAVAALGGEGARR